MNIHETAPTVKLALSAISLIAVTIIAIVAPFAAVGFSTFQRTKCYIVPGTENDERPRTAAIGYFADGILRSVRTRGGKRWGDNAFSINCGVLAMAIVDGLHTFEIQITYKQSQRTITYSVDFETLQTHGQCIDGVSGPELSLPLHYWSIDGATATGPAPEPTPVAEQGALFAFDEPRRIGGY